MYATETHSRSVRRRRGGAHGWLQQQSTDFERRRGQRRYSFAERRYAVTERRLAVTERRPAFAERRPAFAKRRSAVAKRRS